MLDLASGRLALADSVALYHLILEPLMSGRTPGKRIAGVRVLTPEGHVPTAGALITRGRGRGVVIATGAATQAASHLAGYPKPPITWIFIFACLAILPLAGLMGEATASSLNGCLLDRRSGIARNRRTCSGVAG